MGKFKYNPFTGKLDIDTTLADSNDNSLFTVVPLLYDSDQFNVWYNNGDDNIQIMGLIVLDDIDLTLSETVLQFAAKANLRFVPNGDIIVYTKSVNNASGVGSYELQIREGLINPIYHITGDGATDINQHEYIRVDSSDLYSGNDDNKAIDLSNGLAVYVANASTYSEFVKKIEIPGTFQKV